MRVPPPPPLTGTLLVQLESMDRMLRHTLWIVSAGLHSSYKIDKQMCPFV